MEDNRPLFFTPLVSQPGVPPPDWLFGPAGVAGLPAPLSMPQGVNIAVGIDIIEVGRVRKVYEKHGERFLKRVYTENEIRQCRGKATRLAGRFAVIRHVGRRSGKPYETTIMIWPVEDGFVIALTYGPEVDWYRNILAAGQCTLLWHGRVYAVGKPKPIAATTALPAFPPAFRPILRRRVKHFVRLKFISLH